MSQGGALVRTPVKDISVVGRNTQGVRLIRLEGDDQLTGLERIEGLAPEEDPGEAQGQVPGEGESPAASSSPVEGEPPTSDS
jgi:DNA gyrase subunit A